MTARKRLITTILFLFCLPLAGQTPGFREISTPSGANAAEPHLFATRDGLLMSWFEAVPKTNRYALRFSRLSADSWSPARTIVERSDFFVNWADFPSLVEDARGALFAHWLQKSGESTYAYDIRMAISSDGGRKWGPSFLLNRDGRKGEHGFVSLAPLPGGGIGASWLDGRKMVEGKEEGEMTVRYATVDAAGVIRTDEEIDGRVCECCTTAMTMTANGPVIAYRDRTADETRDISVIRRKAKGWTKPATVHTDGWKINGCPVNGPQLDSAGDRVVSAWFTAAQDRGRVLASFSDDGGATFGKPLSIDEGKPVGRVDVVMLNSESAVVTWLEKTAGGGEIRTRLVRRNGRMDASMKIADSSTARAAGVPRTAKVGRDLYVAWTEQTATNSRIHVAKRSF